jgi:hypothetical protein
MVVLRCFSQFCRDSLGLLPENLTRDNAFTSLCRFMTVFVENGIQRQTARNYFGPAKHYIFAKDLMGAGQVARIGSAWMAVLKQLPWKGEKQAQIITKIKFLELPLTERRLMAVMMALGCRISTIRGMTTADILEERQTDGRPEVRLYLRCVKYIPEERSRFALIKCACFSAGGENISAFCAYHISLENGKFRIPKIGTDLEYRLGKLGLSTHSARRTAAVYVKRCQMDGAHLSEDRIHSFFGWKHKGEGKSMYSHYSTGAENFTLKNLPPLYPVVKSKLFV